MYYILISIIVFILSSILFYFASGTLSFKKVNIITWAFFFSLCFQCFLSSVIIVNGWEDHYRISYQLSNYSSRYQGWLSIQWVMLAMPMGMVFVNLLTGKISAKSYLKKYEAKSVEFFQYRYEDLIRVLMMVLSLISILSIVYTFIKIGQIPQLSLFSSTGISATLREDVGRGFDGNSIIRNVFAINLTVVLSYIWYSYTKVEKSKYCYYFFYLFFVLSCLIVTYNLAKSPLVFYLLGFVFLRIYINGFIKLKYLMCFFVFLFSIILISYYFLFDDFEILSINRGIGGRLIIGQSMGVYFSFDLFPSKYEHLYFSSISRFISDILNTDYIPRSSRLLMEALNPSGVENGTAGVLNTLFIGEAWANFGIVGVILSPLIVGAYIQTVYLFFIRSKKHPIYLGLFAYLSYKMPIVGGFNDFIYNPLQWIIIILIFSTILVSSKRIK